LIYAISDCKFRVLPTTQKIPTPLTIGIPQIDSLDKPPEANNYTFQPRNPTKLSLHVTPFIASDPNIRLIGPTINGNARTWSSSKVGSDSIVFIPTHEEIGLTFTIEVTSTNASYYTVVLMHESQNQHTLPPPQEYATHLLSGYEIQQQTEAGAEYYYILHVPPNLVSDIVVIVTPLYGDVDLFMNRQQDGFYFQNLTSPESTNASKWSSELSFGQDSIVVNHQDSHYLMTGGRYFITVRAVSHSQFILRGYTANTIITLAEGNSPSFSLPLSLSP
jgi:hypothetical protein